MPARAGRMANRDVRLLRRGSTTATALLFAVTLLARVDAYFDQTSCSGELCVAPWAKQPVPLLRWADRPALCAARSQALGEFVLVPCNATDEGQIVASSGPNGWLKSGGRCLTTATPTVGNVSAANRSMFFDVCVDPAADGRQRFELPATGQGPIRAGSEEGFCLTVLANDLQDGGLLRLLPCEPGSLNQTFFVPSAADGSAFVGVNLGGWLILEDWMWPAKMLNKQISDEYSLIKANGGPGDPRAQKMMRDHWDTFLQPRHLDMIRRWGATHVRIPLGYWLFDAVYNEDDGFVAGGEQYLARALGWLKARGMHAVLDLHAMPGAQAVDQEFTGKQSAIANFFLDAGDNERGQLAVKALAELVLRYEKDPATAGVVVGIQLLNEPTFKFQADTFSFYEAMVREVRQSLPADRYLIMLGFMDSPHTESAEWLADKREEDPANFAGVVFDVHLYHLYGDNTAPWNRDMDYCKTCCRDAHILEPMTSRKIPTIVGEFGVATGFNGWADDDFLKTNLANQMSLWNTTESVVGSFLWNFRILPDPFHPRDYLEWSLIDMIAEGAIAPDFTYKTDLATLCPEMGERMHGACPAFGGVKVIFNTKCMWHQPSNSTRTGHVRRLRGASGADA
eukprot:CAMPEP_0170206696 /NCGR_PEP_ID=MMETSP0116_2-20130129/2914_1 /TAXON_ID=400756 /ORGANISM="Durinskia baltica, Strain CSIRO CS-38" /LENGTH=623 /DNA_ID=CAMNT_0010457131 /DNA_START=23 /DNA_END=1894 /DNA_ORIENTATION=-